MFKLCGKDEISDVRTDQTHSIKIDLSVLHTVKHHMVNKL